jgi:hypothetical protein
MVYLPGGYGKEERRRSSKTAGRGISKKFLKRFRKA